MNSLTREPLEPPPSAVIIKVSVSGYRSRPMISNQRRIVSALPTTPLHIVQISVAQRLLVKLPGRQPRQFIDEVDLLGHHVSGNLAANEIQKLDGERG